MTFGADHPGGAPARAFYAALHFSPVAPAPAGPESGSRELFRLFDGLTAWERTVSRSFDALPTIVVHELAHIQPPPLPAPPTLCSTAGCTAATRQ